MKTTGLLLLLFVAILGGGYLLSGHSTPSQSYSTMSMASSTSTGAVGTSATTSAATYTAAQVAMHNTSQSCWASINGNVYDLTAWVGQHPGGEADILNICGTDGTQAFEAQHGRSRDTQPQEILATFKIGTLSS